MKRREFLNLTMGSAVAAAVPLPSGAVGAVAKAPKHLYPWAVAMAHAGNPISEKTLGMALKVSADQASALMSRLVARGVVHAPNAAGVARAVSPAFRAGFLPEVTRKTVAEAGRSLIRDGMERSQKPLRDMAQSVLETEHGEQPDPPAEEDPPTTADPVSEQRSCPPTP